MARPIACCTDFGLADEFVGTMHAVIEQRAPGTRVIDLTHGIPRQDVAGAAHVLRRAHRYLPAGCVVLCVVDPGVGTGRAAVAVEGADGRAYVAPDNGVLDAVLDVAGGARCAVRIASSDVVLIPTSATFHGRDVFAPAAAALAAGRDLSDLGPPVDARELATLPAQRPLLGTEEVAATCWQVDTYGNCSLLLRAEELRASLGLADGAALSVRGGDPAHGAHGGEPATWAATFADVDPGELVAYADPYGEVAVAANRASAADRLGVAAGDRVRISPA